MNFGVSLVQYPRQTRLFSINNFSTKVTISIETFLEQIKPIGNERVEFEKKEPIRQNHNRLLKTTQSLYN